MLECVINVSEGRDQAVIDGLRRVAGRSLLDLHHDALHNRSVLTLAGPEVESAARAVTALGVMYVGWLSSHLLLLRELPWRVGTPYATGASYVFLAFFVT